MTLTAMLAADFLGSTREFFSKFSRRCGSRSGKSVMSHVDTFLPPVHADHTMRTS
jgi:hypothetical protein